MMAGIARGQLRISGVTSNLAKVIHMVKDTILINKKNIIIFIM
jgi:hypothetical protein